MTGGKCVLTLMSVGKCALLSLVGEVQLPPGKLKER
jgi:hypothetical protein